MNDSKTSTQNNHGPALPPAMANIRKKSADEVIDEISKLPLFMTTLQENDDVEALRALAYDGTPLEVAGGFKENGNECFKAKKWKDARIFYEKAIDVLTPKVLKQQCDLSSSADTQTATKTQDQEASLLETCLVNRAACHLELQNYRSCGYDCVKALHLNPRNVKAYYRSSKALLALNKLTQAKEACECGLKIDPLNQSLLSLSKDITLKTNNLEERERIKIMLDERQELEALILKSALRYRNVTVRKTKEPNYIEGARIMLIPNPINPRCSMNYPTLFLYPLYMMSELVKVFDENDCIQNQLNYLLPPPWDTEGVYKPQGVQCFVQTISGEMIHVGRKHQLREIVSLDNTEIIDDLVNIYLVPKSKVAAWAKYENWKIIKMTSYQDDYE